jgi:5'-methylthioadenosine phosphorylase
MRIGVLIGSVMPEDQHGETEPINTEYGPTSSGLMFLKSDDSDLIFISRHGIPSHIPPHRVNHKANVTALKKHGCELVISVCSTGALSKSIEVPTIAVPEDYIDPFTGETFFDDRIEHITPLLDPKVQEAIVRSCLSLGTRLEIGGTYVQMRGPRLETRSEVRLISTWGEYVGMNLGPEATLVQEAGMRSGALLTVDNYANGIAPEGLDFKDILLHARSQWSTVKEILSMLPNNL